MKTEPNRFPRFPNHIRSIGAFRFTFPIEPLIKQFLPRFIARTLECLERGQPVTNVETLLEEASLHADTVSLDEFLADHRAQQHTWNGRIDHLRKLDSVAADLAKSNGGWRAERDDFAEIAEEAMSEIQSRIQHLANQVFRERGVMATHKVMATVVRRLLDARSNLQQSRPGCSESDGRELAGKAARLGKLRRNPGVRVRLASALRRDMPVRWLIGARARTEILRSQKSINRIAQIRHKQLDHEARLKTYDELLGTDDQPGRLVKIVNSINRDRKLFAVLRKHFSGLATGTAESSATTLPIVAGLDTVIDPRTQLTVGELFFDRADRAGCTPAAFAERIRKEGLSYQGRNWLPHEWSRLKPSMIARLLDRSVCDYLGCTNDTPIDINEPKTALDHIGTITLLSTELRGRLVRVLKTALARSRPYACVNPILNGVQVVQSFVYCYPDHRCEWVPLLRDQIHKIADVKNAEAYSLRHPYALLVVQYLMAAPPGAMPAYWKWMSAGNSTRKRELVEPIFDRRQLHETRLLPERVRHHADCEHLFEAARKCSLVCPHGEEATKFVLSKPDSRLDHLFAPLQCTPNWQTEEFFYKQLKQDVRFLEFLNREFPGLVNIRTKVAGLVRETDYGRVAAGLESLGVIVRRNGQCRINKPYSGPMFAVPDGFYTTCNGPLIGLSREEFVATLLRDDFLYNVVFWSVLDSHQLGRLSENEIPLPVLEMSKQLN